MRKFFGCSILIVLLTMIFSQKAYSKTSDQCYRPLGLTMDCQMDLNNIQRIRQALKDFCSQDPPPFPDLCVDLQNLLSKYLADAQKHCPPGFDENGCYPRPQCAPGICSANPVHDPVYNRYEGCEVCLDGFFYQFTYREMDEAACCAFCNDKSLATQNSGSCQGHMSVTGSNIKQ